jgi:hypothetical protein
MVAKRNGGRICGLVGMLVTCPVSFLSHHLHPAVSGAAAAACIAGGPAHGPDDPADRFSRVLARVLLSTSPSVRFPMPFLYSSAGATCPTRHLLPDVVFTSPRLQLPGLDCFRAQAHQSIEVGGGER